MESGLNPDAAEFVPFGGKSDGPAETDQPTEAVHASAVPAGLDEVLAASPSKGSERSIEDVDVPSESEFNADIASRPADLDSDISFGLTGKDAVELEEEDTNPFVANNDVDDVLSSPTTPPAGGVEFATGEHPPLDFQPMESTQPPLAFQPFDNSQPLISMSAEISSHFNFIDSHLAPEDDQPLEQQDEGLDFDRLVLSKNHFTHEAEENKIEEDARESEVLDKAEADFSADIMITSFHEGLSGGFSEPPLSQKELLVGDEKHFMDKEENHRPLSSDLDSSFEVVAPLVENPVEEDIVASDDDEIIVHSTEHTGLTNDMADLTIKEEPAEEHPSELEQHFELKADESHFTESLIEPSFTEKVEEDLVELPICNNIHEEHHVEPEVINNFQELQRESVNPFHDESSSFNHIEFSSQNPFETELNNLTEEKSEEFIQTSTTDIQETLAVIDEPLQTTEDHFSVGADIENPAPVVEEEETTKPEEEPSQIVETSQFLESSHMEVPTEDSPAIDFEEKLSPVIDEEIPVAVEAQPSDEVSAAVEVPITLESPAVETPVVAEEISVVQEEALMEEASQLHEVGEEVQEQVPLDAPLVDDVAPKEEIITFVPVCNGTSGHDEEVSEVVAVEQPPEPAVEEASIAPAVAVAAAGVATAVGGARIASSKGKNEPKPAASSKAPSKPTTKSAPSKPATTLAAKKSTAAPLSKPATKSSVGLTAAAKPKTAPSAKPAVAAKTAPATKSLAAKPTVGAAKPAASAAAKTLAAKPAAAKPASAAAKQVPRPSVTLKPAAPKPTAAAKPSAPAARPITKSAAPAAKPAASATRVTAASAKPAATTAAKPASRPSVATTLAAKKPAAPAAKPATAKAPVSAKPAAAKPATTAAKSAITKKPATSTSTNAAGKKPVGPIKKGDSPKKVVNGGPHIDLPEPVTSTNGHLESPPIATH